MQPALVQVLLGQDRPDTSTGHAGFLEHLARGQASIVASCSASQIKARRFSFSVASCHACRREDARWIVGGKLRAGTRHAALSLDCMERRSLHHMPFQKTAMPGSENMCDFFKRATAKCHAWILYFAFACLVSTPKEAGWTKKNAIIR